MVGIKNTTLLTQSAYTQTLNNQINCSLSGRQSSVGSWISHAAFHSPTSKAEP